MFNAARAAREAGYSAATAAQHGLNLLKDERINAAVQAAIERHIRKMGLEAQRVYLELMAIAFSDIRDVIVWNGERAVLRFSENLPPAVARAVKRITVRPTKLGPAISIELYDKQRALELLMRATGLLQHGPAEDNRGAFHEWAKTQRGTIDPTEDEHVLPAPGLDLDPEPGEGPWPDDAPGEEDQ